MNPPLQCVVFVPVQREKGPRHRHAPCQGKERGKAEARQCIARFECPCQLNCIAHAHILKKSNHGNTSVEHLLLKLLFALPQHKGFPAGQGAFFPCASGIQSPDGQLMNQQAVGGGIKVNFDLSQRLYSGQSEELSDASQGEGLGWRVMLFINEEKGHGVSFRRRKIPIRFMTIHPRRRWSDVPFSFFDGNDSPDGHVQGGVEGTDEMMSSVLYIQEDSA